MNYISLFAGIGGFDLALNRLGHTAVYVNEWDKYASQTYEKNFGHKPDTRDITTVPTTDIPEHDLLVGGFPCQAFSVAGKRLGFAETRGTLFFEIARILRDKRPRYFLLENVKGLLSHDQGKTFSTIIGVLTDLGYGVQWQVLNSKNFGVPQNRERVFIIGHLRTEPRPEVLPIRGSYKEDTRTIGEDVSYALDANYHKGTNTIEKGRRQLVFVGGLEKNKKWLNNGKDKSRNFSQGERIYSDEGISPTLSAQSGGTAGIGNALIQINQPKHSNERVYDPDGISPTLNTMQGGKRQPFIALTEVRTEEAKVIRREHMKQGKDFSPRRGKQLVPRKDELANTLTANQSKEHFIQSLPHGFNKGWQKELPNLRAHGGASFNEILMPQVRRLTPVECERLQGFPDGWTDAVSDTQRYKQLGNAVTVNVVYELLKRFKL